MHCDTAREQLDALADGELKPWAAWQVRRHLTHCPACTTEVAAIRRLTARARAWQDVSAPARLREKLPTVPASRPARAAWQPTLVAVAGAAVIVAITLLTPGQLARPTVTFADMQNALRQVNIVSYDNTFEQSYSSGFRLKLISHHWLRRDPPAVASISRPEECLPPGNTQPKVLQDARGITTYYIPGKFTRMNISYLLDKRPGAALTRQGVEEFWPMLTGPFSSGTPLRRNYGEVGTPMRAGTGVLAGRAVSTFVRRYHYPNGRDVSHCVQTIFVDPKTSHVIQVDTTTQTGAFLSSEVATNFRYDVPPPPGTFDWSPPKGASVEVEK